jgi:hypothetical protein
MVHRSGILIAGILVCSAVGAGVACNPPDLVGKGGECNSLSDCKPGLTCIEDKCTDDLESIAGEVPVYATDAGAGGG